MYMGYLPTCVSVYYLCAWCPQRTEEGMESPGTGVIGGREPTCRCCEWSLGPLEKRFMFFTSELYL